MYISAENKSRKLLYCNLCKQWKALKRTVIERQKYQILTNIETSKRAAQHQGSSNIVLISDFSLQFAIVSNLSAQTYNFISIRQA